MVRGQPDFGLYTQTPVASGISDPGEAAARLGSINVYDRRGWTVWMDDFEAPDLKWTPSHDGAGTLPVLSSTLAWMGVQSVYLVTAAVADRWAQIQRYFPLVRLGKVGVEFWIYLSTVTPNYFRAWFHIYDGSNISRAELQLNFQAQTATIVTSLGTIVVATKCFNTAAFNVWTPIKLVVDVDADYYTRLLIGSQEIDLSAHALWVGAATNERLLRVDMTLLGGIAGIGSAYLDNFILTQNEP